MNFRTKIDKSDTKEIVDSKYINFEDFKDSTFLVTGATGLIGSQFIKALLYANEQKNLNIKIFALVRNKKKAESIFKPNVFNTTLTDASTKTNNLRYIVQDITKPIKINETVDYIVHTANGTSSKSFVETPVETIDSIILGTKNILEFSRKKNVKSIVYLSSMEVYGKTDFNREEPIKEDDFGYTNILNVRNSYPVGKQLAENMCLSYSKEYNVPVKIARLSQTIGAGVDIQDNRVFAQFARNIIYRNDLVLQTQGETTRSYIYITDAVTALFVLLRNGHNGEAYNVSNTSTKCSIKEMAEMLTSTYTSSKLLIQPQKNEYYLDKVKLVLDTQKLESLNWKAHIGIREMFDRLIQDFYLRPTGKKIVDTDKTIGFKRIKNNLFSIKNSFTYKKICVLGQKFYLPKKNKYELYKKISDIKKNKIILYEGHGQGYCGNLKYIADEILRQNIDCELVWIDDFSKPTLNVFPEQIRKVNIWTKEVMQEFATSKIWLCSQIPINLASNGLDKKEGQYYIQVWHGSLGIKKIGFDANPKQELDYTLAWKKSSELLDYAISNSDFEDNVYRGNFYAQGKYIRLGHSRSDIFFRQDSSIKEKVYQSLNISSEKKLILYAPTFREKDLFKNSTYDEYNLEYQTVITECNKKFGADYVLVARFHPVVANNLSKLYDDRYIINGNKYDDIQELLVASDIVISDYSSLMFDYMITKKPIFIYATDISEYDDERGFYYPLDSTPFPIATNMKEFTDNIRSFNYDQYKTRVDEFLMDKGCVDDGHSSERIVDFLKGILNE